VIPDPLRSQVRDAIARAWAAAVESGDLAALPEDAPRPSIDIERPAKPEHGDLSTNLAMKLAKPYRRGPLELATLLAAKLVRGSGPDGPIEATRQVR
jgi:arginyl-tRNA synthetase